MLKKSFFDFFLNTKDRVAIGHLDSVTNGFVVGWAWYSKYPTYRPIVDIFVDEIFVGQAQASIHRNDLIIAGIGDGFYGFEYFVGNNVELSQVRCFVVDSERVELINGKNLQDSIKKSISDVYEYLHATFDKKLYGLKNISRFHSINKKNGIYIETPLFEKLLEKTQITKDITIYGHMLSAYLDYQLHKFDLQKRFCPHISSQHYQKYLLDYIQNYGRARYPDRVPLSRNEIEFLLEGPSLSSPYEVSRIQLLFKDMFAYPINNNSEMRDIYNAFYWIVYQSPLLKVEDCLISSILTSALSMCEDDYTSYPLSLFMKIFFSENKILSQIDIKDENGRMLSYFVLLLFAMESPHICQFIPDKWFMTFICEEKKKPSLFDKYVTSMFPNSGFNVVKWREFLEEKHYNLLDKKFNTISSQGNRIQAAALSPSNVDRVDVQIIAPFSKELGISKSALVLSEAMNILPYTFRLCDYTKDYPNTNRDSSKFSLQQLGPASINIIHLNLEEAPSLIAYSPDVFTGSRVIIFPYLELPKLNSAQYLGLSLADEIWCASDFIKNILAPYKPTHLVGAGLPLYSRIGKDQARRASYAPFVDEEDFIFLASGDALSGVYRKNLLGVICAFVHAFPEILNVKLILKVHSLGRVVSDNEAHVWNMIKDIAMNDPRIILMDRAVSDDEQQAFIEGADCLVSLHRAEGLGYHMLEAMQLMTPVIATAYSGNMDFCNEQNCMLIPANIVNVEYGQYPRATAAQTWAEPSFDASVEAMRKIYLDVKLRETLSANAFSFYKENFTLECYSKRIRHIINDIL
jgi:glycosyltransferase involved in cell wall biosynthesis